MHHVACALCALGLSVIAMTAGAAANPLAASAFSYDTAAALDVRIEHRRTTNGITREDVTFAAPGGSRIRAETVSAQKVRAGHAGVLFVHWLGDSSTTNLTEFEPDALALARHGITSVLVDAMWAQPHWFMHVRSTDTDYRDSIAQVVSLRRALDVLQTQPGVDARRLAYVGHDFGAMYGAVLSGVDPRPRWFVLMALDPGPYLARSKADAYLFQFSQKDEYIAPEKQLQFFQAAPLPKALYLYDADHRLRIPQAFSDRQSWLFSRLTASQH